MGFRPDIAARGGYNAEAFDAIGIAVVSTSVLAIVVGGGFGIAYSINNHKSNSYKPARYALVQEIETNITQNELLSKFELQSISCSKDENDGCYADIFGKAIVNEGDAPVFVNFKYDSLNSETYDKLNRYIKTIYTFDKDGKISNANMINNEIFWPTNREKIFISIFKQIAEVTKNKAIEKNIFGASEELLRATSKSSGEDIVVRGISSVYFDEYLYSPEVARFQIDTVKVENDQLISKRIEIAVDLFDISKSKKYRTDLLDNPLDIYEYYAKNPDKCEITEISSSVSPIVDAQTTQNLDTGRE